MFALHESNAQPHTLRDTIARYLRDEIVTGALRPNEVLKDVELASRLGISTTPVREALSQLERLIIMPANRPKRVAPLSKRHTLEMYAVFQLLAAEAYRKGPPALTAEALTAMRRAHEALREAVAAGDRHAGIAATRAFHDRVFKAAGNGALRRVCARSFVWLERAMYAAPAPAGLDMALERQATVLAALDRRDFAAATSALLLAIEDISGTLHALPDDPAITTNA